jgi:hypothetical protein
LNPQRRQKTAGLQQIEVIEPSIIVPIVGERTDTLSLGGQFAQLKEFLLFLAHFMSVNQSKIKDGPLQANGFCQSLQALFRIVVTVPMNLQKGSTSSTLHLCWNIYSAGM